MEIRALAGPMNREQAEVRHIFSQFFFLNSHSQEVLFDFALTNICRHFESVGRHLHEIHH